MLFLFLPLQRKHFISNIPNKIYQLQQFFNKNAKHGTCLHIF